MAQIPLLDPRPIKSAKTGKQTARLLQLKSRVRNPAVIVVKIVVSAELLRRIDFVVKAHGELVATLPLIPGSGNVATGACAIGTGRERRYILLIERKCGRIETLNWNLVVWENARERSSRGDRRSPCRSHGLRARCSCSTTSSSGSQERRKRRISERSGEKGSAREIAVRLSVSANRRKRYVPGRLSLNQPVPFIRSKNECLVFLDGTAHGSAELILLIVQQERVEKTLGVQRLIAEELVEIAVQTVRAGFRHHVDNRPGVAPVFRIEGVGDDSKFFNRIR